ncbi:MAG TPA: hypothetical protein VFV98_05815 [Vicinamibacterales bacterium]|nr:hypothetical protein [Vicinamibacterales bacterium]
MKTFTLTFVLCLVAASASAQQQSALPAPLPTQPAAPPQLATLPPAAAIPVGSRVGELPTGYDSGGRRDPFLSLIAPKRVAGSAVGGANSLRPRTGLGSIALADVAVKGIVKNGKVMLAILEGANKQSFVARVQDRLLDGAIKSIDNEGVVFVEAADPGMRPNEIRKTLRPAGEVR